MPTRNLNILITGATSGIGEALAVYYAKTSAKNLFICGRNPERLKIVENKCRNFGSVVYGKIVDVQPEFFRRQCYGVLPDARHVPAFQVKPLGDGIAEYGHARRSRGGVVFRKVVFQRIVLLSEI